MMSIPYVYVYDEHKGLGKALLFQCGGALPNTTGRRFQFAFWFKTAKGLPTFYWFRNAPRHYELRIWRFHIGWAKTLKPTAKPISY